MHLVNECCLPKATETKQHMVLQVILAALPSFIYIIQQSTGTEIDNLIDIVVFFHKQRANSMCHSTPPVFWMIHISRKQCCPCADTPKHTSCTQPPVALYSFNSFLPPSSWLMRIKPVVYHYRYARHRALSNTACFQAAPQPHPTGYSPLFSPSHHVTHLL